MTKLNQFLLSITLLLGVFFSSYAMQTSVHPQNTDDDAAQKMILHYVNIYRAKHWLGPLKLNDAASKEAAGHSQAMANKTVPFGHTHFNTRIQRLYKHLNPCRGGAENVAFYRTDPKKLVDGWINSPGHRKNILGSYNVTGIGIAHGKPGWAYFTQIFIRTDNKAYT